MRSLILPLIALMLALPLGLALPPGTTTVHAGDMSCEPPQGSASSTAIALGAPNSGTFTLEATGTAIQEGVTCTFAITTGPSTFVCAGLPPPCGGTTVIASAPCTVTGHASCTTTTTFSWWRADHGVCFEVPFTLFVNGIPVASGTFRFCDPPLMPTVVL